MNNLEKIKPKNCEKINAVKSASKDAALCQKAEVLFELALLLVSMCLENVVRAGDDFLEPSSFDLQSFPAVLVSQFCLLHNLKLNSYYYF